MTPLKKILIILFAGIATLEINAQKTELYIIGTVHDSCQAIGPQDILSLMESIEPQVILCELEEIYFTTDYQFNLETYPDLLSTNENIATHRYQLNTGADIRPYEIEGRNQFYRESLFFENQNQMFADIMKAYRNNVMSQESHQEWKRYMETIELFDILHENSLKQINSPLYVAYSDAKNQITYATFISVTQRDFPQWLSIAQQMADYWKVRNDAMSENILKWIGTYKEKRIVVLTGQQHKPELLNRLKPQQQTHGFVLKD